MYGSCVPVCAVAYPAITELISNGLNGIIFKDAQELAMHLTRLLSQFPHNQDELKRMRQQISEIEKWDSYWDRECAPLVQQALMPKTAYGMSRNRLFIGLLLVLLFCLFSLENAIYIAMKFMSSAS